MTTPIGPSAPATLSIHLPSFAAEDPGTWAPLLALARDADAAGVDRLYVSDHVVFGDDLTAYADPTRGGTAGGVQPTGPDGHWLEPLTLLSVIAGSTDRIRLGTGILLAALRTPTVLAKQLATLDVLSDGRVDLGVGVGWQQAEYDACGLPFHRRGRLLDHTLDVCRRLWTEPVTSIHDEFLDVDGIHMMPKPRQAGGVPIWVSGRINPRTIDRLVRFGSGWIPWGEHIADPGPGVAILRAALDDAGRAGDALQVQGSLMVARDGDTISWDRTFERLPELVAAGVTDVRLLHPWSADPSGTRALLGEAVDAFRAALPRSTPDR